MIYDCFTFFNELDLLEIRLNVLNDVVDKFVLVEATKTFSGKDKPLYYEQNKKRFSKFKDKIIHVIVDGFPAPDEKTQDVAFMMESYQRNAIMRGLKGAKDDDVIIIADLDEIPNPDVIKNIDCSGDKIWLLQQKTYYYFLNYVDISNPYWENRVKVLSYYNFTHYLDNTDVKYTRFLSETVNTGTTPSKIRMWPGGTRIKNGGWHFSFLGGIDAIRKKIDSFSHQEFNSDKYTNPKTLQRAIMSGKDLFDRRDRKYRAVSIDKSFPKYIVENQDKYKDLIFKITPGYRIKLSIIFAKQFCISAGKKILKFCIDLIPVAKWRKKTRKYLKSKEVI